MSENDFPRIEIPPSLRRKMLELAREFRKQPSKSEAILWNALRRKQLDGVKFRRQQPIGPFVVDFYNAEHRLVVEVDGEIHEFQGASDRRRQDLLEALGLHVLRLRAGLVEDDLLGALAIIRSEILEIRRTAAARPPFPRLGGRAREGG